MKYRCTLNRQLLLPWYLAFLTTLPPFAANTMAAEPIRVVATEAALAHFGFSSHAGFEEAVTALFRGAGVSAGISVFEDSRQLRTEFLPGNADLVFCTSLDYFELQSGVDRASMYTLNHAKSPHTRYAILSNKNNKIRDLGDIINKDITLSVEPRLGSMILYQHLQNVRVPRGQKLFGSVSRVAGGQQAIRNLIAGRTDVVLVPLMDYFEVLKRDGEGGGSVNLVLESQGYVAGLVLMHRDLDETKAGKLNRQLASMAEFAPGRSALEHFQARHAVRVMPADLRSLEQLVALR